MPEIPINCYQATFVHSIAGTTRQACCTLGLSYEGSTFSADAESVAQSWENTILGIMTDNLRFMRFTLADDGGVVFDSTRNQPGGNPANACPSNTAYLFRKSTALSGRQNRGRMYVPGVEEAQVDNAGFVSVGTLDQIGLQISGFMGELAGLDMNPVILHNTATAPTPITQIACQTQVATQRRRLRG